MTEPTRAAGASQQDPTSAGGAGCEPAATPRVLDTREALRAHYGEVSTLARDKALDHLDRHCRRFIELSPFLVLATTDADGFVDASPRGDAPGFVTVPDPQTLLIPDRRGNNRVDSLGNLIGNPRVGILFMVPGVNETLRVNGRAQICIDPALLADFEVRGRAPQAVLRVRVEQAFLQCAKALVRSHLWDPARHVARTSLPSLGAILADQIAGTDAQQADAQIEMSMRERLY